MLGLVVNGEKKRITTSRLDLRAAVVCNSETFTVEGLEEG